jgi:hypothetical protein
MDLRVRLRSFKSVEQLALVVKDLIENEADC